MQTFTGASKSEDHYPARDLGQPLFWAGLDLEGQKSPTTPRGPTHHLPERRDSRQGQIQVLRSSTPIHVGTEITNTILDIIVIINFE